MVGLLFFKVVYLMLHNTFAYVVRALVCVCEGVCVCGSFSLGDGNFCERQRLPIATAIVKVILGI